MMTASDPRTLIAELTWRGLLHQYTEGLPEWLDRAAPVGAYCGFDPTASSLHVGNLVPVMGLVHLQRAGHRPIALVGGGTGLIGDPSGKPTERPLAKPEEIAANALAIRAQLERFLDFSGPGAARMLDNAEWLTRLGAVEFMRDVGKHFTINYMTAKESVRARMDEGISYTEFSYMLLQAYDFLELHRREGATLQIGGSDQWGNITAGIELIRRTAGREAHGLTLPLVTTAAGTKFGKTEAGAVWLDPARTSPYQFYQFWINIDDRDVGRYLRYYTLLPRDEVEALDREVEQNPAGRAAQRALARDVTRRVHGQEGLRIAEEVTGYFFGRADVSDLSEAALKVLEREVPFTEAYINQVYAVNVGTANERLVTDLDIVALCVLTGLTPSRGMARRLISQGGLYVNNRRVSEDELVVYYDELLRGHYFFLTRGRKHVALVRAFLMASDGGRESP